jgi:hypothetical protein
VSTLPNAQPNAPAPSTTIFMRGMLGNHANFDNSMDAIIHIAYFNITNVELAYAQSQIT